MSALHVVFKVAGSEYVVPARDVVQMETWTGATHVPGAPPHVVGLVQLRGRVLPVVDLRKRFGLPEAEATLQSRIVVVSAGERLVGLLADSAREVIALEPDQLRAAPRLDDGGETFVEAVAQIGRRLLMRLDFAKVIGAAAASQEVSHGAHG